MSKWITYSHFKVKIDPFTHILWVNGSISVILKLYIRSLMYIHAGTITNRTNHRRCIDALSANN